MGIYQKVCYVVEDLFVRLLIKDQNPEKVRKKVQQYRHHKELQAQLKKQYKE